MRYVSGTTVYDLSDPDFSGMAVHLEVAPLADATGFILDMPIDNPTASSGSLRCHVGRIEITEHSP